MSGRRWSLDLTRRLAVMLALLLAATCAAAQDQTHPLKPPDLSSPRATLKTFLQAGDDLATFLAHDYLPAPTREKFGRAASLGSAVVQALDLSAIPPAARMKTGRAAAVALYEVLSRLPLPPFEQIPDAEQIAARSGTNAKRWVIPDTEIALVRAESEPRAGEFLFSSDTVARASDFYGRVRRMPYIRPVPLENLQDVLASSGGWMIPFAFIRALPSWLHFPIADQPGWKWIGVALILGAFALVLRLAYRVSRLGRGHHPLWQALAQFAMPVSLLVATPAVADLALFQIFLTGGVASAIELAATAVMFVAGAWMSWRFAAVVEETIISSPRIAPESIDAHLIRFGARLLGILASAALLALGADRLGVPLYGIIAGLGVGGLAIALAAQPTIENLIGSMNLFADTPIRVGDFCKYGDQSGTVEAIGLRSARIRGVDRTLTTIPNAALAKMPIVNFTRRDKMLINAVVGLRYETTPEQLRHALVKLRETLMSHPRLDPSPARARLVGFGASSLDIELFAYVMTKDWPEFLGIREEILLRVMEIIEESGTSVALPSRMVYLGRVHEPDQGKALTVDSPPAGSAQGSDAKANREP
jgi:MscS family membrane protein